MLWLPFWRLPWTSTSSHPSSPPTTPLPPGITRTHISTPNGALELLSAVPPSSFSSPTTSPTLNNNSNNNDSSSRPPPHILFLHGGFGSAAVWLPYLTYLSTNHGIPCHAVSLRGHGGSWRPGYWRMVWGTGLAGLAEDVVSMAAVEEGLRGVFGEGLEVVLVGHSSGGGLAQWVVEREGGGGGGRGGGTGKGGRLKGMVRGVGLLAGTPCFGQIGVYWNWLKHDPFFPIRVLFHLYHPLSPLSTLPLVKGAFFSPAVSDSAVKEFQRTCMTGYESMIWPNQMMRRLVYPRNVLLNLVGWGSGGQKVLVVAGRGDKLMGTRLMKDMVEEYRGAYRDLVKEKKIDGDEDDVKSVDKGEGTVGQGVRYVELDAAHHLQNDVGWEEGAERLAEFWAQL